MSSSLLSGISGAPPLNQAIAAVQASAKSQPTSAQATAAANSGHPLLLVPTKPPLSDAVLAELTGQNVSVNGSPLAN